MTGSVVWGPADLTGGPVDEIFADLRRSFDDIHIERLTVTHPADDDNVWYITRVGRRGELQLDSAPGGAPPFLLESESERGRAGDVTTAVGKLTEWLNA